LHKLIVRHFNLSEIRSLCFQMNIKFDELGGELTLDAKTQELIDYMDRRLMLYELVETLRELRPKAHWPKIAEQTESVSFEPVSMTDSRSLTKLTYATGFHDLDRLTGGFQGSTLSVVAGRPGMGKSTFVATIALSASLRFQRSVTYFSLQTLKHRLVQVFIALEAQIAPRRILMNELDANETILYNQAATRISTAPLTIIDHLEPTLQMITNECKRLSAQDRLGLVVIDGVEHLLPEGNHGDTSVVSARKLHHLARILDVPIIATVQVKEQVEDRRDSRPQIRDLPGDWWTIPDCILALYRDDYYYPGDSPSPNIAEVRILRNRSGQNGTIELYWHSRLNAFRNLVRYEIDL